MPPLESAEILAGYAIVVAIVVFLVYLVLLLAIGLVGETIIRGKRYLFPRRTQEEK